MLTDCRRVMAGLALVMLIVVLSGCASMRVTCQDRIWEDGSMRRKVTYRTEDAQSENDRDLRQELAIDRIVLPGSDAIVLPPTGPGWSSMREEFNRANWDTSWSFCAQGDFPTASVPAAFDFKSPGRGWAPGFEVVSETHIERTADTLRYTSVLDYTPAFDAGMRAYARFIVEVAKLDFPDVTLPPGFEDTLTAQLSQRFLAAICATEDLHVAAVTLDAVKAALAQAGVQAPADLDTRLFDLADRLPGLGEEDADPETPEARLWQQFGEDTNDALTLVMFYEPRWEVTMPWPIAATNGSKSSKTSVRWDFSEKEPASLRFEMTAEARKPK